MLSLTQQTNKLQDEKLTKNLDNANLKSNQTQLLKYDRKL